MRRSESERIPTEAPLESPLGRTEPPAAATMPNGFSVRGRGGTRRGLRPAPSLKLDSIEWAEAAIVDAVREVSLGETEQRSISPAIHKWKVNEGDRNHRVQATQRVRCRAWRVPVL